MIQIWIDYEMFHKIGDNVIVKYFPGVVIDTNLEVVSVSVMLMSGEWTGLK